MSAPERIWAMPSDDGWMSPYCGNAPHDGSTEYVRADICDPTQDERVKALVAALHGEATHRLSGHPHRPDMHKVYAALRALEQGNP